jgi:hypothetical protein
MSTQESGRRSPWVWWVGGFFGLALLGMGIAAVLFVSWTGVRDADRQTASAAFDEALALAGQDGPRAATAYLYLDESGQVHVRRELEHETPGDLHTLHLLAWDPHNDKLLRVDFPYWFVRVKMNDTINLGTMTTALSGDWEHLELKVSVGELRRRGAGVVLDHTRRDGMRLLLWSEAR